MNYDQFKQRTTGVIASSIGLSDPSPTNLEDIHHLDDTLSASNVVHQRRGNTLNTSDLGNVLSERAAILNVGITSSPYYVFPIIRFDMRNDVMFSIKAGVGKLIQYIDFLVLSECSQIPAMRPVIETSEGRGIAMGFSLYARSRCYSMFLERLGANTLSESSEQTYLQTLIYMCRKRWIDIFGGTDEVIQKANEPYPPILRVTEEIRYDSK